MIASVNTIGIALVWSNEREPTWAVYDPGIVVSRPFQLLSSYQ
jgi:hypothetical protein